jgi:hypothetical protein
MVWKKDDGALIRWLTFSSESLSKIDDIEFATLKIHLVLEDALKYLLASRLGVDDQFFSDSRIDFSVLVEVALAGMNKGGLLGALRALNTARNHLSHRMESPKFIEELEVFVCQIANMQRKKIKWPTEPTNQLHLLKESFNEAASAIFDIAINLPKQKK